MIDLKTPYVFPLLNTPLFLFSAEARVTNSNNYPILIRSLEVQVAKATNRQKNSSAEESPLSYKRRIWEGKSEINAAL